MPVCMVVVEDKAKDRRLAVSESRCRLPDREIPDYIMVPGVPRSRSQSRALCTGNRPAARRKTSRRE